MKTIDQFRRWLAEKIAPIDMVEFTRKQLAPHQNYLSEENKLLAEKDGSALLGFAENMYANPFFKKLVLHLVNDQIDEIARRAPNERAADFCRASINGIELLHDEFARLSSLYREKTHKEKFNQYDVI